MRRRSSWKRRPPRWRVRKSRPLTLLDRINLSSAHAHSQPIQDQDVQDEAFGCDHQNARNHLARLGFYPHRADWLDMDVSVDSDDLSDRALWREL
jgi:hypothetical protein